MDNTSDPTRDPTPRAEPSSAENSPFERLTTLAGSRTLCGLLLALLCGLVALRVMQPIANTDLGWHLAMGRYIAESGAVPDREPFTHTARGAPMVAHEWLSQWIYHSVEQAGGLFSLRALHAGVAVVILLYLFALLRREGAAPALALLG